MGILFTTNMGFLFTITLGILFTIVLGIQFTISTYIQLIYYEMMIDTRFCEPFDYPREVPYKIGTKGYSLETLVRNVLVHLWEEINRERKNADSNSYRLFSERITDPSDIHRKVCRIYDGLEHIEKALARAKWRRQHA